MTNKKATHGTASVFINDAESGLLADYEDWLEELAPHEPTSQYRHNNTGEDNADAHLKRQVMGREVVVAITKGKPDLGPCLSAVVLSLSKDEGGGTDLLWRMGRSTA